MATRLSFRPRPLDLNKPLTIVRDINELDTTDGLVNRDITHQHEALDRDNEEVSFIFCLDCSVLRDLWASWLLENIADSASSNFQIFNWQFAMHGEVY